MKKSKRESEKHDLEKNVLHSTSLLAMDLSSENAAIRKMKKPVRTSGR